MTLPIDTDNIALPAEASPSQRKDDEAEDEAGRKTVLLPADENLNEMYKEVLKIQPGSPHEGICLFCTFRMIDQGSRTGEPN